MFELHRRRRRCGWASTFDLVHLWESNPGVVVAGILKCHPIIGYSYINLFRVNVIFNIELFNDFQLLKTLKTTVENTILFIFSIIYIKAKRSYVYNTLFISVFLREKNDPTLTQQIFSHQQAYRSYSVWQ